VEWIDLARVLDKWRALVNVIKAFHFPGEGNYLTRSKPMSFFRKILLHKCMYVYKNVMEHIMKKLSHYRLRETNRAPGA